MRSVRRQGEAMKRAHISKADLDAFPEGAVWNAFVDLLSMADTNELSAEQVPAQLAFFYDAEVQNGGHLQYFLNRGVDEARRAVAELPRLGAGVFSTLLEQAVEMWNEQERKRPGTAHEYVDIALEGEFSGFDFQYYEAVPTLNDLMEAHLALHQDLFVVVDQ